jgi:hypothetical protein
MEDLKTIWEIEMGFKNDMGDYISYDTTYECEDYEEVKKEFDSVILNTPKHNDYVCLWKLELVDGEEVHRELLQIREEWKEL